MSPKYALSVLACLLSTASVADQPINPAYVKENYTFVGGYICPHFSKQSALGLCQDYVDPVGTTVVVFWDNAEPQAIFQFVRAGEYVLLWPLGEAL